MRRWIGHMMMVLAACALFACSREDVPAGGGTGQDMPISFMTGIDGQSETRANICNVEAQFTNFRLYGVKKVRGELKEVFDDYGFVQQKDDLGNIKGWEYASHLQNTYAGQSRQYWDGKASEYRMIAGAPYSIASFNPTLGIMTLDSLDAGFTLDSLTSTLPDDTVKCPFFAYPKQVMPADYGNLVDMTFRYAMSLVRVFVKFDSIQATPMLIKDLTFGPNAGGRYVNKGKLELTYNFEPSPAYTFRTVYNDADLTADSLHFSDIVIPDSVTEKQHMPESYWMLPTIPDYNSSWTVHLTVTPKITGLGEKTFSATIPADDMLWEPGCSYSYVLELSDDGVDYISRIQSVIKEWNYNAAETHNFYNW